MQSAQGIPPPPPIASRRPEDIPLRQLSTNLLQTYLEINANYYKQQNLLQEQSQSGKKKAANSQRKKSEKESLYYKLRLDDEIFHNRYRVAGVRLGRGSFGEVVEALDMQTGEKVAIKIVKRHPDYTLQAQGEIATFELLHQNYQDRDHPGQRNIVQLRDAFMHQEHQCLVFERLNINLYEVSRKLNYKGMGLKLIAKITGQIVQALSYLALPSVNVIHCDLKPENILLVQSNRHQLKLIDFGSSYHPEKNTAKQKYVQSRFYRSPEVILGMKYTPAIDMWSLGCILVEMHTGKVLFSGADQYDMLRRMIHVLGMPPREVLMQSPASARREFFDEQVITENGVRVIDFRLKVRKPVPLKYDGRPIDAPISLADILGVNSGGPDGDRQNKRHHSRQDYHLLLDLLQRMLDYNPETRITPGEVLQHPFLASFQQKEVERLHSMRLAAMRDGRNEGHLSFQGVDTPGTRIKRRRINDASRLDDH